MSQSFTSMDARTQPFEQLHTYTHKELEKAFRLVSNKSNWKNPTCTKISKKNLDKYGQVIREAVWYFTGSSAEFTYDIDSIGRKTYWCEFDGYYICIGS